MKSSMIVCFVAAAVVSIAILGHAQSIPPATDQLATDILPTRPPVTLNPHDCDCEGECKTLHHSRVPYKEKDFPNYLSYESFPVLCRDAAALMLPPGDQKPKKKYVCKQTFDCCRKCNHVFYVCLKKSDQTYGSCIRAAYKCMCNCIDKRSYNELPHKPGQ